jgi:hypothetical protein
MDKAKFKELLDHALEQESAFLIDFTISAANVINVSVDTLKVKEQYLQNVGRDLKVTNNDNEELVGELISFKEEILTLQWEERVPKEIGKGKVTVKKEVQVNLADVKEAKVQVRFK